MPQLKIRPQLSVILGVVLLVLSTVLQLLSGAGLAGMVWCWLVLAMYILLPGMLWYRVLGLAKVFSAIRGMLVLLLGTGFFAVCYCFAGRFGLVWLLRLVPLVPALAELFLCLKHKQNPFALPALPGWMWPLLGFCSLIFALYISVFNADPAFVGKVWLNQDLLWNAGNAESFKLGFPPQDIRFVQVRLAYHYLTEMVAGALSWVSGLSAYHLFAFYLGTPVLAAVLLCLWQLGLVLYREDEKRAGLLCGLVIFGGCASLWASTQSVSGLFANTQLIHVITNINAQGSAVIFMSVFLAVFTLLARQGFACTWQQAAVFLASVFMMTFAKGPEAAILIVAFAIVMVMVLAFQRPSHPVRALLLAVSAVAMFAVIYFAIFASGANTSMYFSNNSVTTSVLAPWLPRLAPGSWQYAAMILVGGLVLTFCMQPVQLALYFMSLPGDLKQLFRLAPERLLARGTAVGGMMAYCLFWHTSSSQIYFAFVAFFCMNLIAADVLPALKRPPAKGLAGVLLAVSVCSAVCMYGGVCVRGAVQLTSNLGYISVENEKYSPALSEDADAAAWLAENMPAGDIFATNRIHTAAWRDDGISNLYSALSGRQAYMEGYTYPYTNEGVSEPVIRERQKNNGILFDETSTADQIRATCAEIGVNWLVYSVPFPGSDTQLSDFALVYENAYVRIYRVD